MNEGRDVDVEASDGKTSVLKLLRECEDTFQPYERDVQGQAQINTLYLDGRQRHQLSENRADIVAAPWLSDVPYVARNVMRNMALTRQAVLLKGVPSAQAWPAFARPDVVSDASVSNAVLDYWRQEWEWSRLLFSAEWKAICAGTAYARVVWDTTIGPVGERLEDPLTGAVLDDGGPLGDVRVDLHTVFDTARDPTERLEDAEWCYFRRWLQPHDARSWLKRAGISGAPALETMPSVFKIEKKLVPATELWYRPGTRLEKGLRALVVGGHVVDVGAFPYEHGELPLAEWKVGLREGSPHGYTPVSDAVPLQAQLNKVLSTIATITRKTAEGVKLLASPGVVEQWGQGSHAIAIKDASEADLVRWIGPPQPPAILFAQVDELTTAISDVLGVNEAVVSGGDPTATRNARLLAFTSELNAQKLNDERVNAESFVVRVFRQALKLAQQYAEEPRIARIIGSTPDDVRVLSWSKADIAGFDVRIFPTSAVEQTPQAAARAAEEEQQAGRLDPTSAAELARTGQSETQAARLMRKLVGLQMRTALQGGAVTADESIDPAIAIEEIQLALEVYAQTMPAVRLVMLEQLLSKYQAMSQQPAEPMEAAPAAATEDEQPLGGLG